MDLSVCLCTNNIRFLSLLLCSTAWGKGSWFLQKFFLSSGLFWFSWEFFFFYMKLRIALSMSVESCVGIFEENCIEFVDWFWFLGHIKYFFFLVVYFSKLVFFVRIWWSWNFFHLPGWPWTQRVLPVSAFQLMGFKAYIITTWLMILFKFHVL